MGLDSSVPRGYNAGIGIEVFAYVTIVKLPPLDSASEIDSQVGTRPSWRELETDRLRQSGTGFHSPTRETL